MYFVTMNLNVMLATDNTFNIKHSNGEGTCFDSPPVDTGEAPTHIKNIIIRIEGFAKASILQLLKPAVRGVTL